QGRPCRSRLSLTSSQVAPLSSDRKRSQSSALTVTHTPLSLAGDMASPILPLRPLGRPGLFVMSVQVSPPSVDLYKPLSGPPLLSPQQSRRACQTAANRRRGLLGSKDRSAAPASALLQSTCSQVLPPSVE